MHPEKIANAGVQWQVNEDQLMASASGVNKSSLRWVGGFNPFATYDLVVEKTEGSGSVGLAFVNGTQQDSLIAALRFEDGKPVAITWTVRIASRTVIEEEWPVPAGLSHRSLTLRAQMSAVGVNVFLESAGRTHMVGIRISLSM